MLESEPVKVVMVLFHVFGAVIGGGGAFMADAMFFSAMKDRKLSVTELRFLRLASGMVWVGIGMLVVSGVVIYFSDPVRYAISDKFWAKMFIVGFIVINGLVFHLHHLPLFHRCRSVRLSESQEFMARRRSVLISGAISLVSWVVAITLGAVNTISWSFEQIMATYGMALCAAIAVVILGEDRILSIGQKK